MRHDPRSLMIFAAGLGTRMGTITQTRPKPLIEVAGKPLIDHALELADSAGLDTVLANIHYMPNQMTAHLSPRGIGISDESACLLDTGGGLKKALPDLPGDAVFTLNSDAVWTGANPIAELRAAWDPTRMDALLLLLPKAAARGHLGPGSFLSDTEGRVTRGPGLVYSGAQIIRADVVREMPQEVFGLNEVWDGLIARGRLFGALHDGAWCDVGHPEGINIAEALLAEQNDV